MAFDANEQYSSSDLPSAVRYRADRQIAITIATIAGADVLPRFTPMAINTSTGEWVPWTNGGANGTGTISAFLAPESTKEDEGEAGLATSATTETLAIGIVEGLFHHDDIPVPSGELQANLTAALKAVATRNRLLRIQGVDSVAP